MPGGYYTNAGRKNIHVFIKGQDEPVEILYKQRHKQYSATLSVIKQEQDVPCSSEIVSSEKLIHQWLIRLDAKKGNIFISPQTSGSVDACVFNSTGKVQKKFKELLKIRYELPFDYFKEKNFCALIASWGANISMLRCLPEMNDSRLKLLCDQQWKLELLLHYGFTVQQIGTMHSERLDLFLQYAPQLKFIIEQCVTAKQLITTEQNRLQRYLAIDSKTQNRLIHLVTIQQILGINHKPLVLDRNDVLTKAGDKSQSNKSRFIELYMSQGYCLKQLKQLPGMSSSKLGLLQQYQEVVAQCLEKGMTFNLLAKIHSTRLLHVFSRFKLVEEASRFIPLTEIFGLPPAQSKAGNSHGFFKQTTPVDLSVRVTPICKQTATIKQM